MEIRSGCLQGEAQVRGAPGHPYAIAQVRDGPLQAQHLARQGLSF